MNSLLTLFTILALMASCSRQEPPQAANPDVEIDGTVLLYDAPEGLAENVKGMDHKVSVNGDKCFVYRTEATGGGKEYGQVYPEYVFFDFEKQGNVLIEIEAMYDVKTVEILPSRHGIVPVHDGRKIKFVISEPGQYFVKTNGDHSNGNTSDKNLYIFANPKETDIPDRNDENVVWFGAGVHPHQEYRLESGKTYYLEAGAFVYGRFYAEQVKDVRICGRGTLCGEYLTDMGDPGRTICMKNRCENITLEGINIMHAKVWQVAFYQCSNVTVDNVHAISHGQSSDGIDITGCQNVVVKNSFFRGHDDILAVKAKVWGTGPQMNCQDVLFTNCVIWSDSSNPMTIGYETAQNVKRIVYENIDVLSMSMPPVWQLEAVMAIEPHTRDGLVGHVSDITYRDIRVDLAVPQNALFRLSVDDCGNISDITFEDIFVNYGGTVGGIIYGAGDYLVDGVRFNNVRNSDGIYLSDERITRNDKAKNIAVSPDSPHIVLLSDIWDYSTEFSGYSSVQGGHNWYYRYIRNGEAYDMVPDGANAWKYNSSCIIRLDRSDSPSWGENYTYWPKYVAGIHPSASATPCLVWKAPASGSIRIDCRARRHGSRGDGVNLSCSRNNEEEIFKRHISKDENGFVSLDPVSVRVSKGDEIWFIIDAIADESYDYTLLSPIISYLEIG